MTTLWLKEQLICDLAVAAEERAVNGMGIQSPVSSLLSSLDETLGNQRKGGTNCAQVTTNKQ